MRLLYLTAMIDLRGNKMNKNDLLLEATILLGLINAEFQSDPMSVQCFDLRIVRRVKSYMANYEAVQSSGPNEGTMGW